MIKTHFQCAKCKSWRPFHRFPVLLGPGINDGWMTKCCKSCYNIDTEEEALTTNIKRLEKERSLLRTAPGNGERLRQLSLLIRRDRKCLKQLLAGLAQPAEDEKLDPLGNGVLL